MHLASSHLIRRRRVASLAAALSARLRRRLRYGWLRLVTARFAGQRFTHLTVYLLLSCSSRAMRLAWQRLAARDRQAATHQPEAAQPRECHHASPRGHPSQRAGGGRGRRRKPKGGSAQERGGERGERGGHRAVSWDGSNLGLLSELSVTDAKPHVAACRRVHPAQRGRRHNRERSALEHHRALRRIRRSADDAPVRRAVA